MTSTSPLGRSASQLGVLERGLQMTAEYAREREQFDRPIGSFQAVSQRLADGYIDVKGLRLTLTQAAWRVSEDVPAEIDVNVTAGTKSVTQKLGVQITGTYTLTMETPNQVISARGPAGR